MTFNQRHGLAASDTVEIKMARSKAVERLKTLDSLVCVGRVRYRLLATGGCDSGTIFLIRIFGKFVPTQGKATPLPRLQPKVIPPDRSKVRQTNERRNFVEPQNRGFSGYHAR